jgi:hypothetical protein
MPAQESERPHGGYLNQFRDSHYGTAPVVVNDLKDFAVALMHELRPLLQERQQAIERAVGEARIDEALRSRNVILYDEKAIDEIDKRIWELEAQLKNNQPGGRKNDTPR